MDVILTDISAWTVFASGAHLATVPQAEAIRVIEGARATSAAASMVRDLAWWKTWEPYTRTLLGLPADKPVPVHMLGHELDVRGSKRLRVSHRIPAQIPEGFLCKANLGAGAGWGTGLGLVEGAGALYLVSPAVYPLLRAHELNEVLLAVLLAQLWGDFVARPDLGGTLVYRKSALATSAEVEAAINTAGRSRGLASLQAVLPHVAANAHSPMEIALQLSLCLPPRLGGCGLPLPELNRPIELPKEIQVLNGNRRVIRPDLAWMDYNLVVEYDSFQEHDQSNSQAQRDRNRRDIYDRLGLRVITVDRDSIRDDLKRNLVFERIAESLEAKLDWSSRMQIKRTELMWRLVHAKSVW